MQPITERAMRKGAGLVLAYDRSQYDRYIETAGEIGLLIRVCINIKLKRGSVPCDARASAQSHG